MTRQKHSRIEWDELGEGWAIHCCDCGEYLETVSEKPSHHSFTCPDDCLNDEADEFNQ